MPGVMPVRVQRKRTKGSTNPRCTCTAGGINSTCSHHDAVIAEARSPTHDCQCPYLKPLADALEAAEAQVARLWTRVREQAIWRAAYEHADEYRCRLCRTSWIMGREPEVHATDCPAAPAGGA